MPATTFQRVACLIVAVLLVASMAAPAAVAHDDDDGFFDGFVDSESDVSLTERVGLWAAEKASWVTKTATKLTDDGGGNASEYAADFEAEFHAYNDTLVAYANDQLSPTSDYEVFRVHFTDRSGSNVTRYVVADEYNGVYENARVLSPSEFDATNREVDHWVALDWYQSRHAADELDTFVEDYARPNEPTPKTYRGRMLAEYGAPDSDMWATNESDA